MEEHAYREQFELEDTHWWFAGRRAVIWALLRRSGVTGPLRLLDAGCGTGRNMVEFGDLGGGSGRGGLGGGGGPGGAVEGVDFSADAIEFCRRRGLDGVQQAGVEALPFGDDSFDLILATDVIEHLPDDGAALRELRRVAAPGGRLLATVPAYKWLWSSHDVAHHHFRRYTLGRLRQRLRDGGWEPAVCSYFNTALLAPIAAVRLAERWHRNGDGERPDLQLTPPGLNRVLAQPMRLEAALIERGARLPAGVSIGVVAVAT